MEAHAADARSERGRRTHAHTHAPVVVEDLEAVDVEHADDGVAALLLRLVATHLDRLVQSLDDPREHPVVDRLRMRTRNNSFTFGVTQAQPHQ